MSKKLIAFLICLSLLLALTNTIKTLAETNNMETFFNSEIPCLKIQVNATSRAKPGGSISVIIKLTSLVTNVFIKTAKLTIYGFINGTEGREVIYSNNNIFRSVSLSKHESEIFYLYPVPVPENICGIMYGELYLNYSATIENELGGTSQYPFQGVIGFTLTHIENTYLKTLEERFKFLREQIEHVYNVLDGLNRTFRKCFGKNLTNDELLALNGTYWFLEQKYELFNDLNRTFVENFGKNLTKEELQNLKNEFDKMRQEYNSLKGVKSELDNTRTAMIFLVVVAVFFVATTAYFALRRPKGYI
jgi:hypothetical protein